jgi:hypothetical protein
VLPDEDGPEEGFADDLSATWDAMEAGESPPLVPETAEPIAGAPLRDELGRFAKRLREELGEEEPAPASVTTAPEHWSQTDREAFDALPEEAKPLYLEKIKLLESGFNRKFEEIAGERKTYESLKEIFGPGEMQQLADANVTLPQYVGRLVSVAKQLQANPYETLHWLAKQCGVQLDGSDLAVLDHAHEVATQAEAEIAQHEQKMAAQKQAYFDQEWLAFQHEHQVPDSLRQAMGVYLSVNPQQPGETPRQALLRAYEQAKWSDPGIRQSIVEAEIQARTVEAQRKADLAKARNAGRVVRSKTMPGTNSHEPAASWREELERNWDRISA